jgi:hypothetical protein
MSTDNPYSVAIVVDPMFGARLRDLAATVHVWAVESAENRTAADALRATDGEYSLEKGVTMFRASVGESPIQWCADIVGTVEEHHGRYAHSPPVTVLEVYGAPPNPELRTVFARYGFTHVVDTPDGFRARSRPAV